MKTVAELVDFRRDLFFDGAVQISWFENDISRRDKAATNFVFHGPEYHGVAVSDIEETRDYRLTDTVSFCKNIIKDLGDDSSRENPITLAIAGYGTGKSHLGLTLSTLLSAPGSDIAKEILANIQKADHTIGAELAIQLKEQKAPVLVIPINGMGNFDLAFELSRQVLTRLNSLGLDTTPVDELWPRFQQASLFTQRNYDLRREDFCERFGDECQEGEILDKLASHDDLAFQWVNEIFEQANGSPFRAVGQESPQQLIKTLCDSYCGPNKPFHSMLILFDEFGRYLEFAAQNPHVAGDAALQQIFEGVQDNGDKCTLLCFNQYELKVYLSRISRDKQSSIQRYITRYDSARKYYLSSNLETLFAHLIEKKDEKFISSYLADTSNIHLLTDIQKWFPSAGQQSVWQDSDMFRQVIVQGCWPLHPLSTLFLSRSTKFLQQRSAITFVADAFEDAKNQSLSLGEIPWTISATDLCDSPLVKELIAAEEYGQGGAVAQSYETVTQKYEHDFSRDHRHVLLAVLIASKLGLKVVSQQESHRALCALSGLPGEQLDKITQELGDEFGVLEWNERFQRYEIIGDAVPRSAFLAFLRHKIQGITPEQTEELFAVHGKNWARLGNLEPQFAADNNITTSEWSYQAVCTHLDRLPKEIDYAIDDWQKAVKPDELRGQILYCYVPGDESIDAVSSKVNTVLKERIEDKQCHSKLPLLIVLLHDNGNKIQRILAEFSILSGALPSEEKQKFSHFIDDHKNKSLEELKQTCEELIKHREYIVATGFTIEKTRLKKAGYAVFQQAYPAIIPFPFDGFATVRGNAARDCCLITKELLKGTLNYEWIATQEPQAQNRASSLFKAWDCLGEDGEIRLHPRQNGLRHIIEELEANLKTEEVLNVGKLLHGLIAPPYGFNLASAGLILGVFLSSRSNVTGLLLGGHEISSGNWIAKAFVGNFLDFKTLRLTTIRYISGTETGEWQELLSLWDLEPSYSGQVSFLSNAEQLRSNIPLPPGELFERYTRLEEQAHNALTALSGLKSFLEQEERFYERSFDKQDAGNLSRVAKDLGHRLTTMKKNPNLWLTEQIREVEQAYSETRQAVVQFFAEWLSQQSCLSANRVGDFRRRLKDQIGRNLKFIDLNQQRDQLEQHTHRIIASIEERARIFNIIEESQAFLASHRVHAECRVAELRQWIKSANDLEPSLNEAGRQVSAPEVGQTLSRINTFVGICKKQIKQHEERVKNLWNLLITTRDDVHKAKREVGLLLSMFSGDTIAANIEDLTMMQDQLEVINQNLSLWTDLTISNKELNASVHQKIKFELESLSDEDEPPVWDIEETYNRILDSIRQNREQASLNWFSKVSFSTEDIAGMVARECHVFLERLGNCPVFLNVEQNEKVNEMVMAVKKRLNSLKLEGVVEMYNNLSSSLKKQFLEMVSS